MFRITLAKAATAVVLSFTGAVTVGTLMPASAAAPSTAAALLTPQPCRVAGHTLPSGDAVKIDAAGDAWTPATRVHAVREEVCTDGVWVRVTGYGQPDPTPWQNVRAYCHRTRLCIRPSSQLRRALGIRAGVKAWERPEDDAAGRLSTFVWVRGPGGAVRTYVS